MRILVTGGDGMVGSHFIQSHRQKDLILCPTRTELDITDIDSVKGFFVLHRPEILIHFAAYTDVTEAEKERDNIKGACWNINVVGTSNLVNAANKNSSYFIHVSTDNVFSGLKDNPGPYDEEFPTEEQSNRLSWYGWTKKKAEEVVKQNLTNFAIIRISNPVRAKYVAKLDYIRKILELFDKGKLYPMFNDQYLTLTYINEVAETLKILLEKRLRGIYHVSSVNLYTPFRLANLLIEKARGKENAIKPISIEEFLRDNPARYAQFGGLKVEKTEERLHLKFNRWEDTIIELAKQFED